MTAKAKSTRARVPKRGRGMPRLSPTEKTVDLHCNVPESYRDALLRDADEIGFTKLSQAIRAALDYWFSDREAAVLAKRLESKFGRDRRLNPRLPVD